MCGIAGFASNQAISNPQLLLRKMCDAIKHRGPDDEGYYCAPGVGLGMRRLSVIDVAGGSQPIFNETKDLAVVCNGEIYNYPELRKELEGKGHRFSTKSDVETIVHLYEEEGEAFVTRLRGMFAIALWDSRSETLYLARDRFGIKPLYLAESAGALWFASELKALLAVDAIEREVDPAAARNYLAFGYIPAPASIFARAQKAMPGTLTKWKSGQRAETVYWEADLTAASPAPSEGDALERLQELMRDTVKCHLLSDVPLGVFLSGGVDSALIVAFMREIGVSSIQTFTIGFEESSYSEMPQAREAARHFDTNHHERILTAEDLKQVPDLISVLDEPFADSSALPMYFLSQFARSRVTVALSGEGGDEAFAGYYTYVATKLSRHYMRIPAALRALALKAANSLPVSDRKVSFDYKVKRFAAGASKNYMESHANWKRHFMESEIDALFPRFAKMMSGIDGLEPWRTQLRHRDVISNLLRYDSTVYLPDDLLVKNDRMTMAHSLEARVPFCDHVLAEYVHSLPSGLKLKGLKKKYLLKKLAERHLAKSALSRPKAGFNVPLPVWLKGESSESFLAPLRSLDAPGPDWLQPDRARVEALIDDHRSGRRDCSRQIWTLLVLQSWKSRYL